MEKVLNREDWLTRAAVILEEELFKPAGYDVPRNIRYAVSFPSSGGASQRNTTIGQCWSSIVSADGYFEVMISPRLDDNKTIVATLIHEIVHAVVGLKAGHDKVFKRCALAVGLSGPMRSTSITDDTWDQVKDKIYSVLGTIPHGKIEVRAKPKRKKAGTIKGTCNNTKKTTRMTRAVVEEYGHMGWCPCCKELWSFDKDLLTQ